MAYEIDFMPIGKGDGDAICIRTTHPFSTDITVIDGGYKSTGEEIIAHLDKYYGTRTINTLVLTHADDDHARGLIEVLTHCNVGSLRMNRPWLYAEEVIHRFHPLWKLPNFIKELRDSHGCLVELEEIAASKGVPVFENFQGATYGLFTVLAPSRERYIKLIPDMDRTPTVFQRAQELLLEKVVEPFLGVIENWNYETLQEHPPATGASNESSVVQMYRHEDFRALLTGDAGPRALEEAAAAAQLLGLPLAPNLFQIPHQGSRRNVTPSVQRVHKARLYRASWSGRDDLRRRVSSSRLGQAAVRVLSQQRRGRMTQLLDAYLVRARLFPALIAVIPAIALGFTLVPWTTFAWSQGILLFGVGLLVYASTSVTRDIGRRLEPGIYERMGGKPTIVMLRHSDSTISAQSKSRYLDFLAAQLGTKRPTPEEEQANPKAADDFYAACGDWLRPRVNADKKTFSILFNELVAYGFYRNLRGLRPYGLFLNALVIVASAMAASFKFRAHDWEIFALIVFVSICHAAFFLFVATEDAVARAARIYARQLIESTDLLISPTKKAKAKESPA